MEVDQSETDFLIVTLLAILIELCYRLSRALNPNPKPISLADASLGRNRPMRNDVSFFKAFSFSDETLPEVVDDQESESETRCSIRTTHSGESCRIQNQLFVGSEKVAIA